MEARASTNAGHRRRGAGEAGGGLHRCALLPAPRRLRASEEPPRAGGARARGRGGCGGRGARGRGPGGRQGYSPCGRRAPRAGPSPWRRGARGCGRGCGRAEAAPRPAMNQLRGERRGAGVTGKPRGRAEGRTFAISRLAAHSWHSWDSQEFASFWSPEEADGTLRGTAEPLRRCGPRSWRAGGDRWERKWERPAEEKWKPKTPRPGHRAPRAALLLPRPAAPRRDAEGSRVPLRPALSRGPTRYPNLEAENLPAKDKRSSQTSDTCFCLAFRVIRTSEF